MMSPPYRLCALTAAAVLLAALSRATEKDCALVDVAVACPGIVVELRYGTTRNITGKALYPLGSRALVRPETARRLAAAQETLSKQGFKLKIWDAYRPAFVQEELWLARPHPEFVGSPAKGGSLHEWGVAVDVTLIDANTGREAAMPTDFDAFGPAATRRYRGTDALVRSNLATLQKAMAEAGFLAMRDEWWHFVDKDYRQYGRVYPAPRLTANGTE